VKAKYLFITLIISILYVSCSRPKPQLPSNKNDASDSVSLALTQIHNSLIEKEDSILAIYVAQKYPTFTKTATGFWYYSNCNTDKKTTLKTNDKCSFSIKIFNLDGVLLLNENQTIHIGQKETLVGIEEILKLTTKGCNSKAVIPWYLAYGNKGKQPEIPPYTSIYVEISVSEK